MNTDTSSANRAAEWDVRLRASDCTEAERMAFAQWRDADPAGREAFEQLQIILGGIRHERDRAEVRALRNEALSAIKGSRGRVWIGSMAAGLAVLAIAFAVWKLPGSDLAARLGGAEVYATGLGQRSTFVLADGSSVELNAQSRLRVRFDESLRGVELVQGQALFNVAQSPRRPFIVRAANRRIVALGTQFDVRLDARRVQVTLIEGKVRVEQRGTTRHTQSPRNAAIFVLTPGKQFIGMIVSSPSAVRTVDVGKVVAWRQGRIFFEDFTLEEALTEMNKHSAVQISIGSPSLAGIRVNGMFGAGEQEEFVAALEEYLPIASEHRGAHGIVLSNRR